MNQILNYSEKDFPTLNENANKVISRKKTAEIELFGKSGNNNRMFDSVKNKPCKYQSSERIICDLNDEWRTKNSNTSSPSMEHHRCFTVAVTELLSEQPCQIPSERRNKIAKVTNIVPSNNPLDSDKPFRFKQNQKQKNGEKRVSRTKTLIYKARQECEKLKSFTSKIHVQGEFAFVSAAVPTDYVNKCLFSTKERDIKDYLRKLKHFHEFQDLHKVVYAGNMKEKLGDVVFNMQFMSNNAEENDELNIVPIRDLLKRSHIPPYECLLHTRSFKRYCDNHLTDELNKSVEALINQLVKFQCNKYRSNPTRAVANKRYVIGLKQVKKYVQWNKVKLIVFTPDMEDVLQNLIEELKSLSSAYSIPYLFALSRRKLGYLARKKVGIACFGILDVSGAEVNFNTAIDAMLAAKKSYKKDYTQAKEFYERYLRETDMASLTENTSTNQIISDFKRKLQIQQNTNADKEQ